MPVVYRSLFKEHRNVLHTHEGYDIGALEVARSLKRQLGAPLYGTTETRLLIDQNRSIGNPRLFSRFSRHLDTAQRSRLIRKYYLPHRQQIIRTVRSMIAGRAKVLHIAVHSFTPELNGMVRNAEIGILFDPTSPFERRVARSLRKTLQNVLPAHRIRFNYPYRGTSDGLTTSLRAMFGRTGYAGIELEINQSLLQRSGQRQQLSHALAVAIHAAMSSR